MATTKLQVLSDYHPYRDAKKREGELIAARTRLERELAAVSEQLQDDDVASLTSDGAGKPTAARQDADELRRQLRIHGDAVEAQRKIVAREHAAASRLIAEAKRPAYAAIVKQLGKALTDLRAAAVAELEFRDDLVAADIRFSDTIRPLPFSAPGHDIVELIDGWHSECRQYGHAV